MAVNQAGIAIVIKAFLPTGKTLDEQFAALSLVKEAHASSDYSALLKAATIDEVKTEQKTRRVDEAPPNSESGDQQNQGDSQVQDTVQQETGRVADADVPDFIKGTAKKTNRNKEDASTLV